MTRVALYARYSSDQQSVASIEDQFRVCRERAEREGWHVVGTYEDAAITGSTLILRPGVRALLQDAEAGRFDLVLAEALDRVSRDQADVATLFKHLQFARVPLITLSEGEISELHVGLKGTMNALFLKDLAKKTHRGQRGRIEKGFSAGAVGYGYRMVRRLTSEGELARGERAIDVDEALVVNRIFREYASGKSARAIARDLNAEGITGPSGGAWSDTSIRGNPKRGIGIVNNEMYVGVRVWNHKHHVRDPRTGKTVERPNAESEWIRVEVPNLRIVSDDLWAAARRQQKTLTEQWTRAGGTPRGLNRLRRPAHLLTGLIACGVCGGSYGTIMSDRYGCLNHHRRTICTNNRTIRRDRLEERALAGLKQKLVSPENVCAAVEAYATHIDELNRERFVRTETDTAALAKVEKGIAGLIAAIEDGLYQPAMKARMTELERQKAEIAARLAQAPQPVPAIHPNMADAYRRKVERLVETLDHPEIRHEAASALRSIIARIVLTPGEKRGQLQASLHGELPAIIDFANDNAHSAPVPPVLYQVASGSRE